MNFIQNKPKKFQVDISGPKANAMYLIQYMAPFMGRKDAIQFVTNNDYLTAVGQMAYFYEGHDIINDLGEQELKTVIAIVDDIKSTVRQKHEQRKILRSLVQDDAFQPKLSL